MSASFNHTTRDNTLSLAQDSTHSLNESDNIVGKVQNLATTSPSLLQNRIITHNPKAGLNPVVDAAGYLFSVTGKLKQLKSYRNLRQLQTELIHEINSFQDAVKIQGYSPEYIIICRYVLCATIDEVIYNTIWGSQGQWDVYCLLGAFNLETTHQDKFFTILDRAIKEPALYIDLMELMYICLSMGYKGQYRATEHSHYQLEQITNNLYKHIQAIRGSFSKTLSPTPIKSNKSSATKQSTRTTSLPFIFIVTACAIMTLFVSLGYLMDVISNEAYKNISQIGNPISQQNSQQ